MSVEQTWVYKAIRAVDIFGAAVVFRDTDVTISSECGLALRRPAPPRWARWLGAFLNWVQPGHCEIAIAADIQRAKDALALLGG